MTVRLPGGRGSDTAGTKRQVKSPKVYIRDSGLLHGLLDLRDRRDLKRHPKVGTSWEGAMLQQVAAHIGAKNSAGPALPPL